MNEIEQPVDVGGSSDDPGARLLREKRHAESSSDHTTSAGIVVAVAQVGGLHHRYERRAAGAPVARNGAGTFRSPDTGETGSKDRRSVYGRRRI